MTPPAVLTVAALAITTFGAGVAASSNELTRHAVPLLPYVVIHLASVRQPSAMPSWLAFLSGLSLDVATHGPLGYWALLFLVGLLCVRLASAQRLTSGRHVASGLRRTALVLVTMVTIGAVQAVVGGLYTMQWQNPLPIVQAILWVGGVIVCLEWLMPVRTGRIRGFGASAAVLHRGA